VVIGQLGKEVEQASRQDVVVVAGDHLSGSDFDYRSGRQVSPPMFSYVHCLYSRRSPGGVRAGVGAWLIAGVNARSSLRRL
jgi:hypothetical protein